jgi:hypothetical protein
MRHSKALIIILVAIGFAACQKDDPIIPNEEEVITTLIYTLSPNNGGNDIVLSFQDLDGDGGDAPLITNGTLTANTSYTGRLTLLNEQVSPAENITAEIEEENEDHQFFYSSTLNTLNISYADMDALGYPVGLLTTLNAGNPGAGTLTIILRHEPDKTGANVADGAIGNAGGETDIEVNFQINVQ